MKAFFLPKRNRCFLDMARSYALCNPCKEIPRPVIICRFPGKIRAAPLYLLIFFFPNAGVELSRTALAAEAGAVALTSPRPHSILPRELTPVHTLPCQVQRWDVSLQVVGQQQRRTALAHPQLRDDGVLVFDLPDQLGPQDADVVLDRTFHVGGRHEQARIVAGLEQVADEPGIALRSSQSFQADWLKAEKRTADIVMPMPVPVNKRSQFCGSYRPLKPGKKWK